MSMTWKDQGVLAVVPARGGSKGIPRKNLRKVQGRSLIAWAAEFCAELPWLNAAVLSTDDQEMAEEGRSTGLSVPFMRPPAMATDSAGSLGMWQHAWRESEAHFGRTFACSILLQPTTPLRRARDIERCVAEVLDRGHAAAVTVGRVPAHFVPEKILRLDDDACVTPPHSGGAKATPRQALPAYYWRDGGCYAVDRRTLLDDGMIIERDCKAVIVEEQMVNIDDPFELDYCEFLAAKNVRGAGE